MGNYGRIAVLAGGDSSEREISLASGRAVYGALKGRAAEVELFEMGDRFTDLPSLFYRLGKSVVFLALHGASGEDGTVQGMLEEAHVAYTGSGVRASRLAMDKVGSREVFRAEGLRVPGYEVVRRPSRGGDRFSPPRFLCKPLLSTAGVNSYPCVVKPRGGGSSIGLSIVRGKKELGHALEEAFRYGDEAIIEEYIDGRELTVGILEEEPLPVIEITTKENIYDFKAKYSDKETEYLLPAPLGKEDYGRVHNCALRAHRVLGCRDFSRVDMRMDEKGNIYVLEVNTIPGMTKRSLLPKAALASGVGFGDLCIKLVDLAHRRRRQVWLEKEQARK